MRKKRCLTQDAWYEVRTAVNNREPLFRRRQTIAVFCQVFGEARECFAFELRGLRLEEERLSFYIRPADGLQLPAIMQWVKQTFAVRFNLHGGRFGHVSLPACGEGVTAHDKMQGLRLYCRISGRRKKGGYKVLCVMGG
jgi:hypothetical protein